MKENYKFSHYKGFSHNIIMFFFLSLLLNSCETIVNVDLPEHKPVIVVNSFFNPDSVWKVKLTRSRGALENGSIQNITDAKVEVWESGKLFALLKHIGQGNYRAENNKPLPEKTYELRVSVPGYTAVTANDIVPQKVEISEVKVDTIKSSDYTEELELSILFTDPPDIDNKYHIAIWGENDYFFQEKMVPLYFHSSDLLITERIAGDTEEFYGNQAVFDDALLAGKQYELKLRISRYEVTNELCVVLSTVSETYYKYYKSFQKHQETGDNPFSESVIVYNNIQKGLGVFAGYNSYWHTF